MTQAWREDDHIKFISHNHSHPVGMTSGTPITKTWTGTGQEANSSPLRAPSSPPDTPIPMYRMPFSATNALRFSVFSYLPVPYYPVRTCACMDVPHMHMRTSMHTYVCRRHAHRSGWQIWQAGGLHISQEELSGKATDPQQIKVAGNRDFTETRERQAPAARRVDSQNTTKPARQLSSVLCKYTHHSLPPSMMMSPFSMCSNKPLIVASTGAPALTRMMTRLHQAVISFTDM